MVNYDGTPAICNTFEAAHPGHGLGITLWFGAGLVTLGYLAMLGIVLMERKAEGSPEYEAMMAGSGGGGGGNAKDAAAEKEELDESGNVRKRSCLADLRKMPATFWIVCLVITFFYNLVFPFQVTSTRINE